MNAYLDGLSDSDLIRHYGEVMGELLDREIVRSANSPVGDIAESLAADYFGVELEPANTKGYDVRTGGGERVQVKGLRKTKSGRTNLSAIRSDEFDSILVVMFRLDMSVEGALLIPKSAYEDHRTWSSTWKANRLSVTIKLRNDPRVTQISSDDLVS